MRLGSALVVSGLLALGAGDARALSLDELLEFPLPAAEDAADLSDPAAFQSLAKGVDYAYSVLRTAVANPSNNQPNAADPATWTLLSYEGTFTCLSDADEEMRSDLLLVFTSLREGSYTPGGALPPRILGGFVESSLADDDYLFVRDALDDPAGVISDAEGATFVALRFSLLPGESRTFRFQVAVRESLEGTLNHFNRAFRALPTTPIPEPGTLACVGTALAALSLVRRRSTQK